MSVQLQNPRPCDVPEGLDPGAALRHFGFRTDLNRTTYLLRRVTEAVLNEVHKSTTLTTTVLSGGIVVGVYMDDNTTSHAHPPAASCLSRVVEERRFLSTLFRMSDCSSQSLTTLKDAIYQIKPLMVPINLLEFLLEPCLPGPHFKPGNGALLKARSCD